MTPSKPEKTTENKYVKLEPTQFWSIMTAIYATGAFVLYGSHIGILIGVGVCAGLAVANNIEKNRKEKESKKSDETN